MLLEVEHLAIELPTPQGARRVVSDVSFRLDRGESLGVVGESGSGKTMTALALMGLLPDGAETYGGARFEGRDLLRAEGGRVSRSPRRPHRDDLSGADDGAEPVASRRRAGRRAADTASRPVEEGGVGESGRTARPRQAARPRTRGARVSLRFVGRRAAARDDRDGAGLRP